MRSSLRFPLTALALAALALAATGCNKPGDKTAKPETAAATGDQATAAIPGLATEKDQVSYMIGMAMAKQWEPIKDEIDVDVLARAIKSAFAGDKLLLTDEQAAKISESFGERMQAKQIAKLQTEARQNAEAGAAFLADNGKKPGVQTTASGLQYQVLSAGDGAKPKPTDSVRVNYKGSLLDGTVFDDSTRHGGPATIPLQQVVPGWQEGIALMPVGSKYRFWIPAALGYGEQGTPGGPIPPNATLVFEVELLDIAKPEAK
ncbi:FKBP-type peptidyl-prolyl cis-trans isomerase [Cognatiluteimonas weifangensis]|uniref:Peptidyl-prolyl cis-trans isomerase n=1 Tax=Cognatiluteimonas weifangensis TaxID=2303539 RepID=A0A372DKT3_9GAMM|nr:FKBP-type peptidyl-prolyl cis-trans isomerase [Luteimonas weifangensis]RFP60150.1 FKBP-type peptidyl-prolyl cis-trans isomerase [Luteimonas weifangensis]